MKLPLYSNDGKAAGELSVSAKIFGIEPNEHAVHSTLIWFQASARRGTHSTLTRAEVRGGGKKPWRQKGTGRARAGSSRSPLWRTGGVTFGPKPRDYGYSLPKKIKKLALRSVFSDKAKTGKIKIAEELSLTKAKTKQAVKFFKSLKVAGKILVLIDEKNEIFQRAVRNIKGVTVSNVTNLNIYDLLMAEWIVTEKTVLTKLEGACN